MTCDDVIDALTLTTTAGAPPPSPEVTAHLAICAACRADADAVRDLADRLRAELAPASPGAGPEPPPFSAIVARVVRPSRAMGVLVRVAALLAAAAAGALLDHAWERSPATTHASPSPPFATAAPPRSPPSPPPPPPASRDDRARETLAAHPGGLTAALAALDALTSRRR